MPTDILCYVGTYKALFPWGSANMALGQSVADFFASGSTAPSPAGRPDINLTMRIEVGGFPLSIWGGAGDSGVRAQ